MTFVLLCPYPQAARRILSWLITNHPSAPWRGWVEKELLPHLEAIQAELHRVAKEVKAVLASNAAAGECGAGNSLVRGLAGTTNAARLSVWQLTCLAADRCLLACLPACLQSCARGLMRSLTARTFCAGQRR